MEEQNYLYGGLSLFHTEVDGKHHYEVENVLTNRPSYFTRKGDKLMMINNIGVQDLPPKHFVRMLSSGLPVLTMHQTSINKKEKDCPESDSLNASHQKERTKLSFNMTMVRESCLEEEEENPQSSEESSSESGGRIGDEELLLIAMCKTSVSVLQARGCDSDICGVCGGNGCTFNDVVVAAKQCEVSSVCEESLVKYFEKGQVLIQSLLNTTIRMENIFKGRRACRYSSANITISYYKSNITKDLTRGAPVVLNFSGSNNCLKCKWEGDQAILTVECCDKAKLQCICKDDPATWPFVFYMTTSKDNCRRFESAAYSGWFIQTKSPGKVLVDEGTAQNYMGSNFYIFIHST